MTNWLEDLWERDPEVGALVERQLEIEAEEIAEILADLRARWGPDVRLITFSPACTDPAYRGVLPEGWESKVQQCITPTTHST